MSGRGTFGAKLYEIADVYLAATPDVPGTQPTMLSMVTGGSFSATCAGSIDAVARAVNATLVGGRSPGEGSAIRGRPRSGTALE